MAASDIKTLTAKATPATTDEQIINDVAGGNLDRKTTLGSQLDIIAGDVNVDSSAVSTIPNDTVTNAKANNMAVNTVKGRITAGTGDPEDLTAANVRTIINVADGANNYVHPNHSGDVTSVADGAQTIANDAVSYAKMQDVSATDRFLGRKTAGAGDPEELTGTEATARLDNFTSTLKGLVPLSGGGTTNFLRADGTFTTPAAGNDSRIIIVIKSADEIVNNSSTLQDDDELLFAGAANTKYHIILFLRIKSGTTPNYKRALTVPTGATIVGRAQASSWTTGTGSVEEDYTTAVSLFTNGTSFVDVFELHAYVSIGGTAGNVVYQWAQNTANVSDTTTFAGSLLLVFKT